MGIEHRIGELFDGRYRLERRIGAGGMADVYLAQDESLGRQVAIKLLADRYTQDPGFIERFRREATAAAGLTDANIVGIYDRGRADGEYYIAMEYVDGDTLKDAINAHAPLPETEAITYAQQALKALDYAHRRGVIHRDVKPHNMMINGEGVLKVTDFGIARAANMAEMTEVGSIVGTAQYLAPEQARGQAVGPQSDIYSMGVVLYEMLTGELPFTGGSAVEIAMKQVNEQPVPPTQKNRLISPGLEQVVLRALAKDPELRYRSAREMADELERVRRGLGVSQDTQQATRVIAAPTQVMDTYTQAPVAPPPQESRRSTLPWILVALLLLAAAGAGYLIYQELSPSGVEVPDVTGKTVENARQELQDAGFRTEVGPDRESSLDDKGRVVDTDPGPGDRADEGSVVTLFVGAGPNAIDLPDLRGENFNDAAATIVGLGLPQPTLTPIASKLPANTVVRTDPPAGSVPADTQVQVFYSSGSVKVPETAGDTCAEATTKIENVNLVATCVDTSDDSVPEGDVISSDPPAGTVVLQGSTVTLNVSSGPADVTVPGVLGEDATIARQTIRDAGLRPDAVACDTGDATIADGTVVAQDPGEGTTVAPGSSVTIYVQKTTPSAGPCPF